MGLFVHSGSTTSVYDHSKFSPICLSLINRAEDALVYEYTQRIKSTIHQDDGHTNMTEQSLLDGTAFVKFVIRAISGDDEATISLPTRGSLPGQELAVPAFALLEVPKMQTALSELLHTISSCLAKAESLEEGMRQEEDAVQSLSPVRSYLDLMQFMLQMLLRTAREEQRRVSSGTSSESAEPIILDRSSKKTDFLLGLLRETIISLNADDSQHRYIFNQFMRFLFIYVAQGLHFLEFAHSEMDNIEHQIQQSAHVDFESAKRKNEQTYATESTYIIKVLETMLMLAPSFYRSNSETSCSYLPNHSCPIKESTKQIRFCKRHLQNLMAEIAFGYTFNSKLEEISMSPTISDYRLSSYPIETVGVAEWFKSSLWLLVGWDILQSNPSHSQLEIRFFNYNS